MYVRATKPPLVADKRNLEKETEKEEIAARSFFFRLRQGDALFEGALRKRERERGGGKETRAVARDSLPLYKTCYVVFWSIIVLPASQTYTSSKMFKLVSQLTSYISRDVRVFLRREDL